MRSKDKVSRILSVDPKSRDNDKLLMLKVWEIEGLYLSDRQKQQFFNATSPETIRRVRQKLQEEGKFRASEKVDERRYQMYVETKDAIATDASAVGWLYD